LNGGTCVDLRSAAADDFRCQCPPGFTGRLCEQNVASGCSSGRQICFNGATCYDLVGGDFLCSCPTGYSGRQCDEQVGACVSNPCPLGATCIDTIDGVFHCLWRSVTPSPNNSFVSSSRHPPVIVVDASALTAAQLVIVAALGGGLPVSVLAVTLVVLVALRRRHSAAAHVTNRDDIANNRHHYQQRGGGNFLDGAYGDSPAKGLRKQDDYALPSARCMKVSNEERQRSAAAGNGGTFQIVLALPKDMTRKSLQQQQQPYQNEFNVCDDELTDFREAKSKLFADDSTISLSDCQPSIHR
jgi:hypothetical protein